MTLVCTLADTNVEEAESAEYAAVNNLKKRLFASSMIRF
jgi:hypothetical protein